ncbi:hypothetical protein GCM10010232_28210 [Streptomyces amakusaensis]
MAGASRDGPEQQPGGRELGSGNSVEDEKGDDCHGQNLTEGGIGVAVSERSAARRMKGRAPETRRGPDRPHPTRPP